MFSKCAGVLLPRVPRLLQQSYRRLATQTTTSSGASRKSSSFLWSALGGACLGGLYVYYRQPNGDNAQTESTTKQSEQQQHQSSPSPQKPSVSTVSIASSKDSPIIKYFTPQDTTVVFVLGGPGAGKGTQCENLVRDYGFVHLSAGDLLRAERNRPASQYGKLINHYIKEGLIVPMEITIALLEKAMKESGARRFLIDGFPRALDQAHKFEETIVESKMVLYFECPEEEMMKRLLKRGETSGRVDDNAESIKKRFKTFRETSYPVIEHYATIGKVAQVSCMNSKENVYREVRQVFERLLKTADPTTAVRTDSTCSLAVQDNNPATKDIDKSYRSNIAVTNNY